MEVRSFVWLVSNLWRARRPGTHNVIARARYALPKRCLADDRSLSTCISKGRCDHPAP